MSEYTFPAQLDRCALCYAQLGQTCVKGRALPWVFCSKACFETFHQKRLASLHKRDA